MDGFEVAQILKSNKRTSETPIIFVTAELKEHRFVMKGFEEGAIDCICTNRSIPILPEAARYRCCSLPLHRQQRELMEKNQALEKLCPAYQQLRRSYLYYKCRNIPV